MLHTVVMAGGSGTRFWPQSRKAIPKQLLKLVGQQTMIQETVSRCRDLSDEQHVWIATNSTLSPEVQRQLPQLNPEHILVEPAARNTAPCIGLAAIARALVRSCNPAGIGFCEYRQSGGKTD